MTAEKVQPKPEQHEHPAQTGHPDHQAEAEHAATKGSTQAFDELKKQTQEHKKPTHERPSESSTVPASKASPEKTDSGTPDKKTKDDSWWDSLVLSNPFGSSAKPEAPKDASKGDSIWNKLESLLFDDVAPTASMQTGDSNPQAASEHQILSDGTKVYQDGSLELSDRAAKALRDAAPDQTIVQTYKGQDGKDVQLEFKDGKVTRVEPDGTTTEVTKDKIRIQDTAGTTTEIDKQTKRVQVVNAERGVTFEQDTESGTRTFRVKDGPTITRQKDQVVVTNPDGTRQEYTPEEFRTTFRGKDGQQREIALDTGAGSTNSDLPPKGYKDIHVGAHGIAVKDADGTEVRQRRADGKVRITIPGTQGSPPTELLVERDGTVQQIINEGTDEHGKPKLKKIPVTKDHLPPGCTMDADGTIHIHGSNGPTIGKDSQGKVHVKTSKGDDLSVAKRELTGRDAQGRKFSASCTADGGSQCHTPNGTDTTVDTKTGKVHSTDHKGHDVDWDAHSKEFKTKDLTMTSTETTLWNGTKIGTDGSGHDHTGTAWDNKGNVHFADGCTMHADGSVYTPDGRRYHCDYQTGAPKTPDSMAAFATSLAASIAGKTNISPSDIAAMNSVLSLLGGMAAMLTDRGCLTGYAVVKAAEGTLHQALARAGGQSNPGINAGVF